MRRGLLAGIVGGVIVLALAGAVLFYLLAVPGMLASSYKERAEPEHEKVEKALDPVYESFSRRTFAEDTREIAKADGPGEYVRAFERVTARELRELAPARRSIKRAQRELGEIDDEALTEEPRWPLLAGRGELGTVEEIADGEEDHLRKARRFLREYELLVAWATERLRFYRAVGVAIGRGANAIPANATSPGQVTRPVNRSVGEVQSHLRRFKRRKAPKPVRSEHRNIASSVAFVASVLRRFTAAIGRLDIEAAERVDRDLARGFRPYDRRSQANFRKLVTRSVYVRQIKDLQRREGRLARSFEDL